MDTPSALLRLALIPGLGSVTATKLLAAVAKPADVFDLPMADLTRIDGIGPERARKIADPSGADAVAAQRAQCKRQGIAVYTQECDGYPREFSLLPDPPLAVWVQGAITPTDRVSLAVVGPRKPTAYGHRQGRLLAGGLARAGTCIISGLARGIDTVAHEAALAAGGRTIAVLGSGHGPLYPEENRPLAERICDGRGAVISEYPFDTRPSPGTFPRRNRLVAALSLGCLVIEAGARSGSLITARLAAELGREVMALPGPVDRPEHQGSNKLIQDGVTMVTCLDDILDTVGPLRHLVPEEKPDESPRTEDSTASRLSPRERSIYTLLADQPKTGDELTRVANLPPSAIQATLISLELKRMARRTPAGYVRAT